MTDDGDDDWRTADEKAAAIERARELKDQASDGGLRFDAYLPPGLAEWLLGLVCRRSDYDSLSPGVG